MPSGIGAKLAHAPAPSGARGSSSAIDTREAKTVSARQGRRDGTHALRRKAEVEPISLRAHGTRSILRAGWLGQCGGTGLHRHTQQRVSRGRGCRVILDDEQAASRAGDREDSSEHCVNNARAGRASYGTITANFDHGQAKAQMRWADVERHARSTL